MITLVLRIKGWYNYERIIIDKESKLEYNSLTDTFYPNSDKPKPKRIHHREHRETPKNNISKKLGKNLNGVNTY